MDFQNRMIPVIKGNGFNPLNFSKIFNWLFSG